jgi:hypothetical protein
MTPFLFVEVEERFYVVRAPMEEGYVPPAETIRVERKWRPVEPGDFTKEFRYENLTFTSL